MKLIGSTSGNVAEVNSENALKVTDSPPAGSYYAIAAKTGTVGAAIAAGGAVYVQRVNPGYSGKIYIDRMRLRYTTIVAYTTPITQTRSIVVKRGAGAAASGGTSLANAAKKDTGYSASNCDVATGGDTRIATTAALTVTGITFETVNFAEMTLAHVGAAGAYQEALIDLTNARGHPIELNAGELIAVTVGASAMDAAGTWSLDVDINWRESTTEA